MSIKHLVQCLASTKCKIIGSCSYFKTTIITFYWLHQLEFNTAALKEKKKIAVPNKDRYALLSHVKKQSRSPGHIWWLHGVIMETHSVIFIPLPRQLLLFSRSPIVQGGFWSLSQHISVLRLKEKKKDQKKGFSEAESAPLKLPSQNPMQLLGFHFICRISGTGPRYATGKLRRIVFYYRKN